MTAYNVEATTGTLNTTVEAADVEDAITAAIHEWAEDAEMIFSAATFDVRPVDA